MKNFVSFSLVCDSSDLTLVVLDLLKLKSRNQFASVIVLDLNVKVDSKFDRD